MDLTLSKEFAHIPDLRHQVRSLHRFRSSFNRGANLLAHHMGMAVEIDDSRSTEAFLSWAEKIAQERQEGTPYSPDFCTFSCGLLLSEFIRTAPITLTREPSAAGSHTLPLGAMAIAEFWPEGFLLTSYCASLLTALAQQDFGEQVVLAPIAMEIRTWWSFRENAEDDPAAAIGFFDLFLGREPNWQQLESSTLRKAGMSDAYASLQ